MKLVQQSVEYLPQEDLFKQIELAARTCYKSEDKITDDSAKKMVDGLIKAGHNAMLEHGTIYLKYFWSGSVCDCCNQIRPDEILDFYCQNPYSRIVYHGNDLYITTNYRVLIENSRLDDLKYQCEPTEYHIKRYTFRLTTSISIVRELIRHRAFSFANESTRYCNYSKDKFDGVTFIIPHWLSIPEGKYTIKSGSYYMFTSLLCNDKEIGSISEKLEEFILTLYRIERIYNYLLEEYSPQQAREVLSLCTKSELIMTGFEDDWKRFLDVRLEGTTGKPHPDMVELAKMIKDKLDKIKDNGD